MNWDIVIKLIKPELFLLIPFCWIAGLLLKSIKKFNDEMIPSTLWLISIVFSFLYLEFMIEGDCTLVQRIIASFVDGTLIVGVAVFGSQQIKQLTK